MINFPIFNRLDVSDYGLFPGTDNNPGLHVDFQSGLTLILGANGLGKTTLITMLFRLLTGPFDIPGLSGTSELGNINLAPRRISVTERRSFGQRVSDDAKTATACLHFCLGAHAIAVERQLGDLKLTTFQVDGVDRDVEESNYQQDISDFVGISSFGDWILLLRHMVFYFEDRRALVWDATAQRQLLRLLFLPASAANKWTLSEREILKLDSDARNLQFAITREAGILTETELKIKTGADVRQELKALQELYNVDVSKRDELNDSLVDAEARREQARLRYVKSEQERESRYRELERAKLLAIEARFPKHSDTARYILAQILSEDVCLVCGTHVPATAAELEARIKNEKCVVCGSDISSKSAHLSTTKVSDRRVAKLAAELNAIEPELIQARSQLVKVEAEYSALVRDSSELTASISERAERIDSLVRRLPPEEAELHRQREEFANMRGRLATMRGKLERLRQSFALFIETENRALIGRSGEINAAFDRYAKGFLLETCTLLWSPRRARLGQTGEMFEFPAFELDMTGTDFPSPVRRSGPEQVSESQREFIDLAFRMALIEVAGNNSVGTLVIDAPESSLDAVFVRRAAEVLGRFAKPAKGNRLVVTSNLVDGDLVPRLLALSTPAGKELSHLIDLFKVAEPTEAIRQLRDEYRSILNAMLRSVKKSARDRKRRVKRR